MKSQHRLSLASLFGVISMVAFIVAGGAFLYAFGTGTDGFKLSTRTVDYAVRFLLDLNGGGRFFFGGLLTGCVAMVLSSRLKRAGVRLG